MSVAATPVPGGWTQRQVSIAGRTFDLLLPADPDEVLNQLEASADAPWPDPYWAQLWPAAEATAALVARAPWPPQTRILELGCGAGLLGMAALAAGFAVTLSDYVPLAVELALENALRNGFNNARGLVLDWRQPPQEQFAVIIASDILYYRDLHTALLSLLATTLAPGGECWIGDPGRSAAEEFLLTSRQTGWRIELSDSQGAPATGIALGRYTLLKLTRPQ